MERINTIARSAFTMLLAIAIFSGCSKTASAPDEVQGPKETIVLPLVDISNNEVGSLYIDDMNGRAQARISMKNGHYTAGQNMKANITLTTTDGTAVYANCADVNGNTGKCNTFPIKVLSNNSDATFEYVARTQGIVFNVLDRNNNVYAKSVKFTIVIDN